MRQKKKKWNFENIIWFFIYQSYGVISCRSSHRMCSVKKDILRSFAKFTWKHLYRSLFINKILEIKKETPTQIFSCEFNEIFKNTFFTEHFWMAASVHINHCISFLNRFNKLWMQGNYEWINVSYTSVCVSLSKVIYFWQYHEPFKNWCHNIQIKARLYIVWMHKNRNMFLCF